MKNSKEEIIKALEVIKKTCDECEFCHHCPFWSDGRGCLIKADKPESWDINNEQIVWRAFRK